MAINGEPVFEPKQAEVASSVTPLASISDIAREERKTASETMAHISSNPNLDATPEMGSLVSGLTHAALRLDGIDAKPGYLD